MSAGRCCNISQAAFIPITSPPNNIFIIGLHRLVTHQKFAVWVGHFCIVSMINFVVFFVYQNLQAYQCKIQTQTQYSLWNVHIILVFLWPFREFVVDICYLPRVSPVASVVSYDWPSPGQVILKDAVNVSGSLITTGWSRGHSYKNFEWVLVIAWKWRAESPISRPLSLLYSNAIHPLNLLIDFNEIQAVSFFSGMYTQMVSDFKCEIYFV